MITEWLVQVGAGFATWVATLFPVLELPDDLVHADDTINSVFAYGDGLGAWVDWSLVGVLMAIPLVVWVGAFVVRGARALNAHLPFVGGRG